MTIEEINSLTVEGNEFTLAYRILGEAEFSFPEESDGSYSDAVLESEGAKPTLEDLEMELPSYKTELIAAEQGRIDEEDRIQNLKDRFESIGDVHRVVDHAGISASNPAAYFRDMILGESDKDLAETRMSVIDSAKNAIIAAEGTEAEAKVMADMRSDRDGYLAKTDFTQLADAPLTTEEKTEYRNYRDYLRKIPELFEGGQIVEMKAMSFEEWKLDKPIY